MEQPEDREGVATFPVDSLRDEYGLPLSDAPQPGDHVFVTPAQFVVVDIPSPAEMMEAARRHVVSLQALIEAQEQLARSAADWASAFEALLPIRTVEAPFGGLYAQVFPNYARPMPFPLAPARTVPLVPPSRRSRRAQREFLRKEQEPHRRARALLKSFLNPYQRREYKQRGWFHVKAQSGRRYRIESKRMANVLGMERSGGRRTRYCIVSGHYDVPLPDVMLALKLLIETDEQRFLDTAYYASGLLRGALMGMPF